MRRPYLPLAKSAVSPSEVPLRGVRSSRNSLGKVKFKDISKIPHVIGSVEVLPENLTIDVPDGFVIVSTATLAKNTQTIERLTSELGAQTTMVRLIAAWGVGATLLAAYFWDKTRKGKS